MKKEIIMTIPQFLAIQRGEMSYKDLRAESLAAKIIKNPRLVKCFTLSIALMNTLTVAYADGNAISTKINTTGNMILSIIQSIARWVCIIMCLVEITKALGNGTSKDIGKIILKYALAYTTTYLLPFLFTSIEEIFS